ncbi:MAG: hypothetical protein QXQ14_02225 [Candidatus Aenigmatarchaeota archaeon]
MKKKEEEEKFELPEIQEEIKYFVKVDKIIDSRDVERVIKTVTKGKVVLAKLNEIKNPEEFHLVIRDLKRMTNLYKLNLLVIHDEYALISPKNLEIVTS